MAEQAVASARILIVDDNMNALKALGYLLEREGFEVECAHSGEIALERLRRTAIDVVLSDLRMPGLGGLELLESIRASHPDLPVVILTAHGTIENAVDAVRLGASDYLQKPSMQTSALLHALPCVGSYALPRFVSEPHTLYWL